MRSNLEDNKAFNQHFQSGRFSHSRRVLDDDVVLTVNGSLVNFFDANGSDRSVTLPVLEEGRFYVVGNVGASDDLNVRDAGGTLVTSLLPSDTALMFASDNEWMALRGWAALGVFTNSVNGLVPAPNSLTPGSLFLRDDGQWGQVQVTGIVDAFKFITDGVNTATGSGPDTFWLRSSTSQIDITVTNGEAVFGDNANFSINEAFVDHDALLNFVGDEHVAHTGVTLSAGVGLSGGGDISASRTFDFTPSELTVNAAPVLTDYAVMDLATGTPMVTLWSSVNAIFDHNALVNYVADRHIAHSGVSIITAAGSGLQGGGDITASRTLSLDFNALTLDAVPAVSDMLAFYDVSEGVHNKFTITNLNAVLDHNALINYVADQHIAHSGVTLTAGAGLTGGGTIAASRTFVVGAGTGITVNADDVALDTAHVRNVDHSAVTISAGTGLTGGGTIAANRSLAIALNGVTNTLLAQMAQSTFKGRAAGAGTGDPIDLTATQATAILNAFVGDSGAGGTKGLVPAPAAGDASASKFLKADGTWVAPTGSGTVTSVDTGAGLTGGPITTSGSVEVEGSFGFRNRIINPNGQIWQRQNSGAAAVTDDTYAFDRWYAMTQTAGITASQVSGAENGTPYMMRLTQANAAAQRFGLAQIIEAAHCLDLRGENVTLSARVRMSVATTLRYAVLGWIGTADSVTSDWVLDWTSPTFTAGNFFTTTSTQVFATGSVALAANTLTSIELDAAVTGHNNVAVIFWTDSTQAQNVTLDIGKVQLEIGTAATKIALRPYPEEMALCRRYYQKTFAYATAPAQNAGITGALVSVAPTTSAGAISFRQYFYPAMRTTPTLTTYNSSAADANWWDLNASASRAVFTGEIFAESFRIVMNAASSAGSQHFIHWKAEAEL